MVVEANGGGSQFEFFAINKVFVFGARELYLLTMLGSTLFKKKMFLSIRGAIRIVSECSACKICSPAGVLSPMDQSTKGHFASL